MFRKYRYTVDGGSLTEEQREFYEYNGYLLLKNLISHNKLDICQKHFIDICNGKVETAMLIMKDGGLRNRADIKGEYLINKIQDWLMDDILFDNYANDPTIINIVKSIVGPNITAFNSMLINKPPDSLEAFSRHPLHQDLHYFPFRPADRIAASWTAMEHIDESNGCLFVVPGSHLPGKLYQHAYPKGDQNKAYHMVKGFDTTLRLNLIMDKGDIVFFHPLLLHGSGPNKSKGFRKSISVHYVASDGHFIDLCETSQEDIADEIVEMTSKRLNINVTYNDIWKLKSRFVCGQRNSFLNFNSNL